MYNIYTIVVVQYDNKKEEKNMEDNVRAVEYICGHFPMLANKTVEELNGNQKTLKEIIEFYKSVPIEKASSKIGRAHV